MKICKPSRGTPGTSQSERSGVSPNPVRYIKANTDRMQTKLIAVASGDQTNDDLLVLLGLIFGIVISHARLAMSAHKISGKSRDSLAATSASVNLKVNRLK
jgi:hypothetical protein